MITSTFRSGGEHYNAMGPLKIDEIANTEKKSKRSWVNTNKNRDHISDVFTRNKGK